jgi:hypothetical protein
MGLPQMGLFVYIIYIPILFASIIKTGLKRPDFFQKRSVISLLGETNSSVHRQINTLISLFGLLSLPFVFGLSKTLPKTLLSTIGIGFLYLVSLSTLLVGFFPRDKWRTTHKYLGFLLSIGVIGSLVFLIQPMLSSRAIPNVLVFLNFAIILFASLYLATDYFKIKKLGDFFLKRIGIWQWLMISLSAIWDLLLAIIILVVI